MGILGTVNITDVKESLVEIIGILPDVLEALVEPSVILVVVLLIFAVLGLVTGVFDGFIGMFKKGVRSP